MKAPLPLRSKLRHYTETQFVRTAVVRQAWPGGVKHEREEKETPQGDRSAL